MRSTLIALSLAGAFTFTASARADMWCAGPLIIHEWGVHVHGSDGSPEPDPLLPSWFHTPWAPTLPAATLPVRLLPKDNGVRKLPVLHFYGVAGAGTIPVGVEVGFTRGPASMWFPGVDLLRPEALANSAIATAARAKLLAERAQRAPAALLGQGASLPSDPTRQLVWDRLELGTPANAPTPTSTAWIEAARKLDTLWVTQGRESERFVFYEAETREKVPLSLTRDRAWTPTRRAYVLTNRGSFPVHDVVLVHRERIDGGERVYVVEIATLAAGHSQAFTLETSLAKTPVARPGGTATPIAATLARFRAGLIDPDRPAWAATKAGESECGGGRDPAIPLEVASGYRLFAAEVDLLLGVWQSRFFEQPGTTIVYREDPATLDAMMPLSIYTDMRHVPSLSRLGLALWEKVPLP
jgi:hypothetical protein